MPLSGHGNCAFQLIDLLSTGHWAHTSAIYLAVAVEGVEYSVVCSILQQSFNAMAYIICPPTVLRLEIDNPQLVELKKLGPFLTDVQYSNIADWKIHVKCSKENCFVVGPPSSAQKPCFKANICRPKKD